MISNISGAVQNAGSAFGSGVRDGFVGYYQGLWNAVTNPVDTAVNVAASYYNNLRTDPIGTVLRSAMPFSPHAIAHRRVQRMMDNASTVWNDGIYGYGTIVGDVAAQGSMVAAGYGVGRGINAIAGGIRGLAPRVPTPRVPNPRPSSPTNPQARQWYTNQVRQMPSRIDTSQPLQQQAQQSFNMRNQIRTQSRLSMEDRVSAEMLNQARPNLTWEQVVARYQARGFSGDDLWREIIRASQRSNPQVNQFFGIDP